MNVILCISRPFPNKTKLKYDQDLKAEYATSSSANVVLIFSTFDHCFQREASRMLCVNPLILPGKMPTMFLVHVGLV